MSINNSTIYNSIYLFTIYLIYCLAIKNTDNNISESIPESLGALPMPEEQNKSNDLPEVNSKGIPLVSTK